MCRDLFGEYSNFLPCLMIMKMAALWLVKCRKLLFFTSGMALAFMIDSLYRAHTITRDLSITLHPLACFPLLFLKHKQCRGLSWRAVEWIPDIFPSLEEEARVLRSCSETRMVWRQCYISSVFISS